MKYYCLGIKGSGMSTLAQILKDLGNDVLGYDDVKEYKYTQPGLEARQIPIYYDHQHKIDPDTIVTWSKALPDAHPELKRMREAGLTLKKYNEIMGDLTSQHRSICVSGTHGKTTTSMMLTQVLEKLGCNYFVGDGSGYADPKNKLFVVESDEFNRHFLAYHPSIAIITNIELEHTECYRDLEDIKETFQTFANRATDCIIACGDNENIRALTLERPVIYYGTKEGLDFTAKNIELGEEGSSFDAYRKEEYYGHFVIPLYGRHMVLNALATIATADHLGVSMSEIQKALAKFHNAHRRFEETPVKDNIVIDDYAHHPTEITATIEAVRQKYPDRLLVAVFKPNTYSRTAAFADAFAESLSKADVAYVTEIECNRETQEDYPGVSSRLILSKMKEGHPFDQEELLSYHHAVIVFLSCASVTNEKTYYLTHYESK